MNTEFGDIACMGRPPFGVWGTWPVFIPVFRQILPMFPLWDLASHGVFRI
jgi:hypothetical protein